ncbi:hypothetical protein WN944_004039 [Citrus x changshan-huyou]|uniref:Uncharacterized protein n=1 Tax=Citrus x changshan-huyou TaxID=2935761 RepID=A0AAP0M2I6_9ROSI
MAYATSDATYLSGHVAGSRPRFWIIPSTPRVRWNFLGRSRWNRTSNLVNGKAERMDIEEDDCQIHGKGPVYLVA